ncbi:MAG: hypothetical protein Q7K65_05700 [Candidatus Buchananbacteria bacterium]|nr:hypothetical protein [Candidatus Buchananbacteria bacterium]
MREKIYKNPDWYKNPDLIKVKVGDRIETSESRRIKRQEKLKSGEIEQYKLEDFVELSAGEAEEILKHLESHGDKFGGRVLSAEDLEGNGQRPKYVATIGERKIYLPEEPYQFEERRCATVYVESDDKKRIVPRTYYLSNSAASWRYLPEYTLNVRGEVSHFGKGYEEQSLNAPLAVQKKLASLSGKDNPLAKSQNSDLIFAGTARKINYDSDASYFRSVESSPIVIEGDFRRQEDLSDRDPNQTLYGLRTMQKPEDIAFRHDSDEPDFDHLVDSWMQYSDLYGEVKVRVFESNDGQNRYFFGTDKLGRSWPISGETSAKVGTNGLRQTWLSLGDFFTPAYEYDTQAGSYGNNSLHRGKYVDMYKNYLSKIPLIQKFENSK